MKKLLEETSTEGLTACCVGRKFKMVKIVHSKELNKIMVWENNGARMDDLYMPQLVWFDTLR
jgi:hypothetical protein